MNDPEEYDPDEYQSHADSLLVMEHEDHPERFERIEWTKDPQDEDFETLMNIVAKVFRVRPVVILSSKGGPGAAAKHLVAAIWSEKHTLTETASRMGIRGHQGIQRSRKRAQKLAMNSQGFAEQAAEVVKRLKRQAPSILGNYN